MNAGKGGRNREGAENNLLRIEWRPNVRRWRRSELCVHFAGKPSREYDDHAEEAEQGKDAKLEVLASA